MKVEIWSDVMCPFCYIGKRKFEAAMTGFPGAGKVELVWKSFQLDPEMLVTERQNTYQYLADRKGMSYEQSIELHDNVVQMAAEVGLDYRFEISVVANSFDAHRLMQLAKTHGLGDAIEERVFRAYFTEGKDIADHSTLVQLGTEVGLNETEIREVLSGNAFSDAVAADIREAQQIGVRGVPFFVFNRKYAISGAQPIPVFLETLTKSFDEWSAENPESGLSVSEGPVCTPGGACD